MITLLPGKAASTVAAFLRFSEELRINRTLLIKLIDQFQVDKHAGDGAVSDMSTRIAISDWHLVVTSVEFRRQTRALWSTAQELGLESDYSD